MGVFVRLLFGDCARSINKIRYDIGRSRAAFTDDGNEVAVYCYGKNNAAFLKSLGYRPRLLDGRESVWGKELNGISMWRHKLQCWQSAAYEFGEFVFLDWDHGLTKPFPDLWERLRQKDVLQAPLLSYRKMQNLWRRVWRRITPSAAFVYHRGTEAADALLEFAEARPLESEQHCMARFLDERLGFTGGDFVPESYILNHQPMFVRLKKPGIPIEYPQYRNNIEPYFAGW